MPERRSILNPVEQRVLGLLTIVQGAAMLVVGDRVPGWTLRYLMNKAALAQDERVDASAAQRARP
jgi:hypothetical protein